MAAGIKLRADVLVAHVIGELQGGVGTVHMLRSGVRTDRFIVGEPTDLDAATMHAGSIDCQLTVFGLTRHLSKAEESLLAKELMIPASGAGKRRGLTRPGAAYDASRQPVGTARM